jgi:hypothetical protein
MQTALKRFYLILPILALSMMMFAGKSTTILVEAESFNNKGGWVIDQQFMDIMGSPYLMAHGLGDPVENAETAITITQAGTYRLFVRTRNWVAPWTKEEGPGRFQVLLDGKALEKTFGTGSGAWNWTDGGTVVLRENEYKLGLKDLTGFNGRCDAIVLTTDPDFLPPDDIEQLARFRSKQLGIPKKPIDAGEFDLVVVGGGMAGTCTALSAARLGVKVALIQNRPVLGGNNSSEVRVHLGARINVEPYPALGNLVNEIGPSRGGNAQPGDYYEDDKKINAVYKENNISLFLNHHANGVQVKNGKISKVIAQHIETGRILAFSAPLFADCTGDGTIGVMAGAEYMSGRESRSTFNEPTAPEKEDQLTMGVSVQWFSEKTDDPDPFPDLSWGIEMSEEKAEAVTRGDWDWETGMDKNMITEFEKIRDYGMLVVFSNWSYVKNHSTAKHEFTNERLKWVAYIGGKRESRRLIGDFVLTETDLTEQRVQPDGTAPTTWTIDLHYPAPENKELFPGQEFKSIARHIEIYPYPIPFRCLYSTNINNLMMAGRNISVSHVALGTIRLMRTGGMMGEVIGMAASLCKEKDVLPADIYHTYFSDLKELMTVGVGDPDLPEVQNYNLGKTLMED